jgi:hypothetical protein
MTKDLTDEKVQSTKYQTLCMQGSHGKSRQNRDEK